MPAISRAANGDLLIQFNSGKDEWPGSTAYLMRSSDEGESWTDPVAIIKSKRDGGAIHTNVGMTMLRNGDLILPFADCKIRDESSGFPNPKHGGPEYARTHVLISTDHGRTWSEWIAANGGLPWSVPHGRLVEMPDGRLLLSVFASDDASGPHAEGGESYWGYAGFLVSHDGGRSWGSFHKVGRFGEMSLLLLDDGKTLLAALKQRPSRLTHASRSDDGGKTWTEPRSLGTQIKNTDMHLSPSGVPLILGSPVLEGESRPGYIYYSLDEGETWQEGVRLIEPISADAPMAYSVSAINLDQQRMLVTFFGFDPNKPETGDSPWTTTVSYLGSNVVTETFDSQSSQ